MVGRTSSNIASLVDDGVGDSSVYELSLKGEQLPQHTIVTESGTNLICRPMRFIDYNAVREIIPQVSRCNKILPPEAVVQMLNCPTFFPYVVCDAGKLVGYAELHRLPHFGRGFDGRLEKVIILEEYRGQKIAQKFCAFLAGVARTVLNCGRIDLTVEKPAAKAVYANLGFCKVDTEVWRVML